MVFLTGHREVYGKQHLAVVRSQEFGTRKILAVAFGGDGSLYVTMPYYKHSDGVLVRVLGNRAGGKLSVLGYENPRVTEQRVKFTYHRSGQAHFSLSGRVRTDVKVQLDPLTFFEGPVFSLQAVGLGDFEVYKPKARHKSVIDVTPAMRAHGVGVTGWILKHGPQYEIESASPPSLPPVLIGQSRLADYRLALAFAVPRGIPKSFTGSFMMVLSGPTRPLIDGAPRVSAMAIYPRSRINDVIGAVESADLTEGGAAPLD